MKKKLVYIISDVHKSIPLEWTAAHLNKSKYNVVFLLLNAEYTPFEEWLRKNNFEVQRIVYKGKSDIPLAIFRIFRILRAQNTDIVHCHLFDACLVGLIAAKLSGVKRRVHTRHNSTIHLKYHPHAVKYDRLINRLSTDIIAISQVVKHVLISQEGADVRKISLIYHGFVFDDFDNISAARISALQSKYHIPTGKHPVIGIVSRYIHWKGVQYIIPAFENLLSTHPDALLILANANGPYSAELSLLLKRIPPSNYLEIAFEEDAPGLFRLFDFFVHTPIDASSEAFGQVYIEAMAAGIPCIATLSGIANEFVTNGENALVVPFQDPASIHQAMLLLSDNSQLKQQLACRARKDVRAKFDISQMIQALEKLYDK